MIFLCSTLFLKEKSRTACHAGTNSSYMQQAAGVPAKNCVCFLRQQAEAFHKTDFMAGSAPGHVAAQQNFSVPCVRMISRAQSGGMREKEKAVSK